MSGAVIASCSLVVQFGLYWLLKSFLARRLFDRVLKSRGAAPLSERDVPHLAMMMMAALNGLLMSSFGIVIIWEASYDFLYGRSSSVIGFAHWGAQYMIYDLYAMYDDDYHRQKMDEYPQLATFVKKRWVMITHHLSLYLFGYPLIVIPTLRHYKGDFLLGMFFIRDFFNPILHSVRIMQLLKLQDTRLYFLSGVAVVVVQFVFRILNWPACMLLYAAQYHNWDVIKAIGKLHLIKCILPMVFWQAIETYWFVKVLTIASKFVRKKTD